MMYEKIHGEEELAPQRSSTAEHVDATGEEVNESAGGEADLPTGEASGERGVETRDGGESSRIERERVVVEGLGDGLENFASYAEYMQDAATEPSPTITEVGLPRHAPPETPATTHSAGDILSGALALGVASWALGKSINNWVREHQEG